MSTRAAAWLAWSMWTPSFALTASSVLLLILNLSHNVHIFDYWAEYTVTAVCGSTVGVATLFVMITFNLRVLERRKQGVFRYVDCLQGG
jgi:hypothetical protein